MPEMPSKSEVTREDGWYWVRAWDIDEWFIAEYTNSGHHGVVPAWTSCGSEIAWAEAEIAEIGERITRDAK